MTLRFAEASKPVWHRIFTALGQLVHQPSPNVLALSERELRKTLPWLLLVSALGVMAADGAHYLEHGPAELPVALLLTHAFLVMLCLYWIKVPVQRINGLFILVSAYLSLSVAIPAITLGSSTDIVLFAVLNMAACYLVLDQKTLAITLAINLLLFGYTVSALDADLSGRSIWVSVAIWIAGLLIHIGRRKSLTHLDETIAALKEEAALRERAEQRSQVAKKRQALAAMVGGVAHDFNNLLQGITSGVELARLDPKLSAETKSALDIAQDSSLAARDLCSSLLEHSKGRELTTAPLKLAELTNSATRHIEIIGTANCQIETHISNAEAQVVGDFGQLRQALINLVDNATRVARSRVVVTTATRSLDGQTWQTISVADDGAGIDSEVKAHIFDPFFTTRPEGKGLGLTTVAATVSAHGGQVLVEDSELGGANFVIALPEPTASASNSPSASVYAASVKPAKSLSSILVDVFDDLPYLVFYKDTNNRHLRVNSAVGKLRGIPTEQFKAVPSRSWYPDEADDYYKDDQEVIASGKAKFGIREQIEIVPGQKHWFVTDKYPTFASDNQVNGILVICKLADPSDEQLLREAVNT